MNRLLRALMLLIVLGSLVVSGVSYALLAEIKRPADAQATEPVDFEVQSGQSAADILQRPSLVEFENGLDAEQEIEFGEALHDAAFRPAYVQADHLAAEVNVMRDA